MNKDIARYRRALKQHLRCSITVRMRLLSQFDDSLSSFLEDCPVPTYEQLEMAFGPPTEIAIIMMDTVPVTEEENYQKKKKLLRILAGIAAALFIAFSIYIFFFKEVTVITSYDTVIPDHINSVQEGN